MIFPDEQVRESLLVNAKVVDNFACCERAWPCRFIRLGWIVIKSFHSTLQSFLCTFSLREDLEAV